MGERTIQAPTAILDRKLGVVLLRAHASKALALGHVMISSGSGGDMSCRPHAESRKTCPPPVPQAANRGLPEDGTWYVDDLAELYWLCSQHARLKRLHWLDGTHRLELPVSKMTLNV